MTDKIQQALDGASAFDEETPVEDTSYEADAAGDEGGDEAPQAPQAATREELKAVNDKIEQVLAALTKKTGDDQPKTPKISKEQAAAFVANPEKLMEFIQTYTNKSVGEVNRNIQRDRWDSRTYEEFPQLKADQKFQDKVKEKIAELVQVGDYTTESPRLLYVATKMAISEYRPAAQKGVAKANQDGVRGGHSANNPAAKTVADNDPRVVLAKMGGLKGEKLEAFKKSLPPRGTATKKMRINL